MLYSYNRILLHNRKGITNTNIMSRARSQAQRNTRFHYIKLTKSQMPFHHGGWNAKVRSQETLGITCKVGPEVQNKAGQRLTELRERTGHSKHPLSITQ